MVLQKIRELLYSKEDGDTKLEKIIHHVNTSLHKNTQASLASEDPDWFKGKERVDQKSCPPKQKMNQSCIDYVIPFFVLMNNFYGAKMSFLVYNVIYPQEDTVWAVKLHAFLGLTVSILWMQELHSEKCLEFI